jgi:futalosine hydrolase
VLVVAATERELAFVRDAETLVCGIGPVEAALQTARALASSRPDAVLHAGIAGGRGIEPLSLVLGSVSVYTDPAANVPVIHDVEPHGRLLARAHAALPEARVLPIATSAAVDGGTGFEVEAMEGFGVLRACVLAQVPAVELRVIANDPAEVDRSKWRFDEAFAVLGDAVARVLAS